MLTERLWATLRALSRGREACSMSVSFSQRKARVLPAKLLWSRSSVAIL